VSQTPKSESEALWLVGRWAADVVHPSAADAELPEVAVTVAVRSEVLAEGTVAVVAVLTVVAR